MHSGKRADPLPSGSGLVHLGNQVDDNLSIRIGRKGDAIGAKFGAQRVSIFDDAIVHQSETTICGRMRVSIRNSRTTVRRPTSMTDCSDSIGGLLDLDLVSKVRELTDRANYLQAVRS